MLLGGGMYQYLSNAVNEAVESGMHFSITTGNDNKDACSYSLASAEKAVTVSTSTPGNGRAYLSV